MKRLLKWNFNRRFGLEFEFSNSSSYRSDMSNVLTNAGVSNIVRGYEHTRGEINNWVCKTDSSCGIELVSPILKGTQDLKKAAELLPLLEEHDFNINNNCGQHVHVEIADFTEKQVGNLVYYWMKMEQFIMNCVPAHRRSNDYCKMLNKTNRNLRPNYKYNVDTIKQDFADGRNALNLRNWYPGQGTVEFRFGDMTFDPETIKNRVRFLIWFVEMVKILPTPENINWYSPKECLRKLNLIHDKTSIVQYEYSPAVQSMRIWALKQFAACASNEFHKDIETCRQLLEEIQQYNSNEHEDEVVNLVLHEQVA